MKSFAEFKRLAVVGAKFERTFIGYTPKDADQTAIRTVNHVQSNAIAFRADEDNESTERGNRAWFWFPKAGNYKIENGILVLLDMEGKPRMTLRPVGGAQ